MPLLRRTSKGVAVVAAALVLGLIGGAVWTDLTQGNPGQGQPGASTPSPSSGP